MLTVPVVDEVTDTPPADTETSRTDVLSTVTR